MILKSTSKILDAALIALCKSSPHTNINHAWKDPAWIMQRQEAINDLKELTGRYSQTALLESAPKG